MSFRVFIRNPTKEDCQELLSLRQRNKEFYFPWVFLSVNMQDCQNYIDRCQNDNFQGLLICHSSDKKIIGVANLDAVPFFMKGIVKGFFTDDFII